MIHPSASAGAWKICRQQQPQKKIDVRKMKHAGIRFAFQHIAAPSAVAVDFVEFEGWMVGVEGGKMYMHFLKMNSIQSPKM